MKFTIARIVLLFVVICPAWLKAQDAAPGFRVVGYYSLRAASEQPRRVPFKRLTHINLSFLNPDSLGNFTRDYSGLKPFIDDAHRYGVKVLFSIGGGGRHPQYHRLLQDDLRTDFIGKLMQEALKYNVDGLDIDLEGRDIDENYEDFVVELAAELRKHNKLITSAIAVYYKDQLSDRALAQYDFVNIMSYDRTGPWRPENPGPHSTYAHAMEDLEYFGTVRSIPPQKMTLGVPFYGYGYGPELTSKAISMTYGEIVSTFRGAEKVDEWKMPDGKVIYYNGLKTMKEKAALAKAKASGIMIWQIRGDARRSKSLLKAIYDVGFAK